MIRWRDRWEVRDLGSRNGSQLDGEHLSPSRYHPWPEGAVLCLADDPESRWQLTDGGPPVPFATCGDEAPRIGCPGLLELAGPDPILIHRARNGQWLLEHDRSFDIVEDGARVAWADAHWTLHLPSGGTSTTSKILEPPPEPRLVFRVSADEEHVELEVDAGRGRADLGARAHHYLLLTLARLRLEDGDRGVSAGECGWTDQDRLCRMLRLDDNLLHTHIHRARRQFVDAGLPDGQLVIERRLGARVLRLGFADVQIRSC